MTSWICLGLVEGGRSGGETAPTNTFEPVGTLSYCRGLVTAASAACHCNENGPRREYPVMALPSPAPRAENLPGPGLSSVIRVDDLSKRFGAFWALRGASFSIRPGEVLGLIGPN